MGLQNSMKSAALFLSVPKIQRLGSRFLSELYIEPKAF